MSAGTELTARQRAKAQRAALLSQLFAIMVTMVVGGQYMMLYANDELGLSPQMIALIFGLAPFASVLRLPSLPWIQRYGLSRTLRLARVGQAAVIVVLLVLPSSRLDWLTLTALVVVFVGFRELGLGTVWQPLMRHITTNQDRGLFFGRMRTSFTVVNLALSAGIALFVGQRMEDPQYKILLGVALLGTLNSIYWSRFIPEPSVRHDVRMPPLGRAIRHIWYLFTHSRLFRLPLFITLAITLGQLPITIIYFREALHAPAGILGAQIFFSTLGQVLSLILWGKVSDSLGFRPMLAGLLWLSSGLSLILWLVQPFPQEAMTIREILELQPLSVSALMIFGFVGGMLNAGVGIATTSVMHYHVSSRDSLANLNLFSLIQLLFQAALTFGIGVFLEQVAIPRIRPADPGSLFHFDWFKAFNAGLVPLVMVLCIPLVMKLPNLKPWFTINDFFSALRYNPWKSLLGARRLHDEDEASRIALARSLGESRNPLNIEPLAALLLDPSYEVKVEAIRSLSRAGSKGAGHTLEEIIADEERRSLWDHAAWALGELRQRSAVDLLCQRLKPESPQRARAMAARALGKIGDRRAVEPLLETMREEQANLHVVASCCWALLHLDATGQAEHAFRALVQLRQREERYEMLSILCRWIGVTDRWVLVSNSKTSPWESLRVFIEEFPEPWRAKRRSIIDAFERADAQAIGKALDASLQSDPSHPAKPAPEILASLSKVIAEHPDWSPLCVLATVYLLFGC